MAKGFNGHETWKKAKRLVVSSKGKLQEEKIKSEGLVDLSFGRTAREQNQIIFA